MTAWGDDCSLSVVSKCVFIDGLISLGTNFANLLIKYP
jgi:hypothetical protein